MMANPCGSRPSQYRWNSAGSSLRLVRSPEAPKITMAWGSGGFSAMVASPLSESGAGRRQFGGQLLQVHIGVAQPCGIDRLSELDQVFGPADVPAPVHPERRQHPAVLHVERHERPF